MSLIAVTSFLRGYAEALEVEACIGCGLVDEGNLCAAIDDIGGFETCGVVGCKTLLHTGCGYHSGSLRWWACKWTDRHPSGTGPLCANHSRGREDASKNADSPTECLDCASHNLRSLRLAHGLDDESDDDDPSASASASAGDAGPVDETEPEMNFGEPEPEHQCSICLSWDCTGGCGQYD